MNILKFNPKKSKAQAMVEFAIVLPILLLVVYGLIEVGRLIFIVASVNNATRQAARYGSTSGVGPNGIARYLDCNGIRAEIQRVDFLNIIDDADIDIAYDHGTTGSEFGNCNGSAYTSTSGSQVPATNDRVVVFVDAQFDTIVPLVPIDPQTIESESSRTLLLTIEIEPPKEPTITYITADSPDYSLIGQNVTVTVEVTGTATTPTGTVTISGADTNCTISLSGGTGSCTIVFTSVGTKTITATYNGDTKHDPSSDTENHTVKAPTNTIVVDSPDPSAPGATFNVNVTVNSTWAGTPTGTVTVTGADSGPCTITLSGGAGNCNLVYNSSGTKTLTATYSGDVVYDTSTKNETHTVVPPGVTTTTITADSPDPSLVGQSVTVTVAVTSTSTPTGTVAITGADTNCTITLSGGTGSCTVVFNSLGSKTLSATYTPDTPAFLGSSDTEPHTVSLPAPTVIITADTPDPSSAGGTVNVTVSVTGSSTTPTGTVSISGADTNCSITLSGGTGNCNVVFNTAGSKTLTATYSGDSIYSPGTDTEPHSVTALAAPPIPNCNTFSVATHLSVLKMVDGNMAINITNPFSSILQISTVKVTWNHDKGHQTGSDKSLILDKVNLGAGTIWDGNELGPDANIIPTVASTIPANSTSTLAFLFHQVFDRWDNTESVQLFFANPGCESVQPKQIIHE